MPRTDDHMWLQHCSPAPRVVPPCQKTYSSAPFRTMEQTPARLPRPRGVVAFRRLLPNATAILLSGEDVGSGLVDKNLDFGAGHDGPRHQHPEQVHQHHSPPSQPRILQKHKTWQEERMRKFPRQSRRTNRSPWEEPLAGFNAKLLLG